jgi:hypothetical protein
MELMTMFPALLFVIDDLALHRGIDPTQLELKHQCCDDDAEFLHNGHEHVCHDATTE